MKPEHIHALRNCAKRLSLGGRFPFLLLLMRHVFRGHSGVVLVDDFDGDLTVPLQLSEHMQSRMFWKGYYNSDVVAAMNGILQPGMTFIDIGANIGEVSMVAAKRVGPHGKVVAFEPISRIASQLEDNLRNNRLSWAQAVRVALSDKPGEQAIYEAFAPGVTPDENIGLGSLYGVQDQLPVEHVAVTTLDEYLAEHPLDRIDCIKIDIEGSELPCLIGARRTLARHLPCLIVEVQTGSALSAGYPASAILDELSQHGYRHHRIGRNGTLHPISAVDLGEYQNVLCIPPSRSAAQR